MGIGLILAAKLDQHLNKIVPAAPVPPRWS